MSAATSEVSRCWILIALDLLSAWLMGITPSKESKGTLQGMPSSSVEVLEEECMILIAVVQISAQSYFLAADGCLMNPVSRMETIKPSCLLEAPMLCQFNPDFKTVIDNLTWLEMLCSTPSLKQQSVVKDDGSMTWIMMQHIMFVWWQSKKTQYNLPWTLMHILQMGMPSGNTKGSWMML
ncbi:hypothetical protein J3A83DRAFT_4188378 [Scleroderma citrinum]